MQRFNQTPRIGEGIMPTLSFNAILIIVGVLATLGAGFYIYDSIGDSRETKIELNTVETATEVQEVKDEIRNSASFDLYADQLLHVTY